MTGEELIVNVRAIRVLLLLVLTVGWTHSIWKRFHDLKEDCSTQD